MKTSCVCFGSRETFCFNKDNKCQAHSYQPPAGCGRNVNSLFAGQITHYLNLACLQFRIEIWKWKPIVCATSRLFWESSVCWRLKNRKRGIDGCEVVQHAELKKSLYSPSISPGQQSSFDFPQLFSAHKSPNSWWNARARENADACARNKSEDERIFC